MEDRPETSDQSTGLSDTLVDEEVAYRPVNVLAVLGFLLALVSLLVFASRWFLLVPVVAAVMSLAAASKVRRDPEANSGLGLAAAGLAISLLVLAAALVQRPVAQMLHAKSSGAVAEAFVDRLTSSDFVGAYELTLPFNDRRPSAELAKIYYEANTTAKESLAEFVSSEVAERLSTQDEAKPPKPLKHSDAVRTRGQRYVTTWHYRLPGNGAEPDTGMTMRLQRPIASRFGGAGWQVANCEFAPLSN